MVNREIFREIPSHPDYLASKFGNIHIKKNLNALTQICCNGYLFVSLEVGFQPTTFSRRQNHRGLMIVRKGAKQFKRRPVHRLIAEAWIGEPMGDRNIVNHRDGNSFNNTPDNLEWCNHRENLRHTMITGLSPYELKEDNTECRVRDYETGEVHFFTSVADAKHFMNVPIATLTSQLNPIRFGVLLSERYEFRLLGDNRPWFYEGRTRKVEAKYMAECVFPDGTVKEVFSHEDWLKTFPNLPKSMSSFRAFFHRAVSMYPKVVFKLRDAYDEDPYKRIRAYKRIRLGGAYVYNMETKELLYFPTQVDGAAYVGVGEKTFRVMARTGKPYRNRYLAIRESDEDGLRYIKENYEILAAFNKPN